MALKIKSIFFIFLLSFLNDNSLNEINFFKYTKLYFYRLRTTQKKIWVRLGFRNFCGYNKLPIGALVLNNFFFLIRKKEHTFFYFFFYLFKCTKLIRYNKMMNKIWEWNWFIRKTLPQNFNICFNYFKTTSFYKKMNKKFLNCILSRIFTYLIEF